MQVQEKCLCQRVFILTTNLFLQFLEFCLFSPNDITNHEDLLMYNKYSFVRVQLTVHCSTNRSSGRPKIYSIHRNVFVKKSFLFKRGLRREMCRIFNIPMYIQHIEFSIRTRRSVFENNVSILLVYFISTVGCARNGCRVRAIFNSRESTREYRRNVLSPCSEFRVVNAIQTQDCQMWGFRLVFFVPVRSRKPR